MPELPETETIARDLHAALRGAVVREVTVRKADVLRGASARQLRVALRQAHLVGVHRRAKSVVLSLGVSQRSRGVRHLVVTPRFTGTLLVDAPEDAYTCLSFHFTDGRHLAYRDLRRLGTVALLDDVAYERWTTALGPEPLDPTLSAERFSVILRGSARAVKSLLMDQRRLAGVGNIYANEACWRAGVRPSRAGARLARADAARLLESLREVLTESIAARGTTFRDYRDAFGAPGGFAERLAVYGRGGAPCRRCGTTLRESHAIDRRSTVWCAECQR